MKRHLFHIILITIFIGCTKNKDFDTRIIYELSEKASQKITEIYNERKNDSKDDYFYITVSDSENWAEETYLTLNSCSKTSGCIYSNELYKKTNRFLKLNNDLYIPVFISADLLLVKKRTNELSQKLGGGRIFKVDYNGNIVEYGITM